MARALWAGQLVYAESDDCGVVRETDIFRRRQSTGILATKARTLRFAWEGTAHYHLDVNVMLNENAAWVYPEAQAAQRNTTGCFLKRPRRA